MGSCGLVEKHHVHLGEQVRDHGRRLRIRSCLLRLRSYLLCPRLLTAHNTAGSGKIGVAEVEEHREVS